MVESSFLTCKWGFPPLSHVPFTTFLPTCLLFCSRILLAFLGAELVGSLITRLAAPCLLPSVLSVLWLSLGPCRGVGADDSQ